MKQKLILVAILILAAFLRQGVSWNLAISLLSVAGIWYLAGTLFPKQKWFAGITALFLAISPWHISLPPIASLGLFGVVWGVWAIKRLLKGKWLYLSVTLLVLSGSYLISPSVFNLDNAKDTVWLTDQQRREHTASYNGLISKTLHNKGVNYSLSFIEHWGEHFSGDFLFITGQPSLMYLFDIVFILIGLVAIIRKGEWGRWGVIMVWLVTAPIISAFNFGPPDFLIAALMVVPLVMISGYGAAVLIEKMQTYLKGYTIK